MKRNLILVILVFVMAFIIYAKNAYDYYNEAYDLYLAGDYKNAVNLYKKAIKMKPDFVKPYNKIGLAYIALKQVDHALFYYKKAIHTDPNCAEAYYNLGVASEIKYKDDTKKAEEAYEKVLKLNNDDYSFVRASLNLAKIYRKQKKFDDAILLLREAVKRDPKFAPLYNETGLTYFDSNLYDFAITNFKKAIEVEEQKKYPEAATNLGIVYLKQGKLAKAIAQFEEAIKMDDKFPGSHYNYGNALVLNGFYEKAKAHLQKAISLNPEFKEAYYALGKAHQKLNEFDEATKAYKKALEIDKNYTLAKNALDELKQIRLAFRDHIQFKKKKAEGEEGEEEVTEEESELTEEQLAAKKKAKEQEEDVEDLRLPEDKPTPEEGESEE
jgi:tetratricopeptide (TPR) repeat protein